MTTTPTLCYATLTSPIGEILITTDHDTLTGLYLTRQPHPDRRYDPVGTAPIIQELRAYFAGELREFTIPIRLAGTPFQRRVWAELRRIPYGQTISYAELAQRIGNPPARRAVGAANAKNPISIIVPCHRVIASDGTMGGFSGGLWRKKWLLRHEIAHGG